MIQLLEQIPAIVWILLTIGILVWVLLKLYRVIKLVKTIKNCKPAVLLDLLEQKILKKIDRIEKVIVPQKRKIDKGEE